MKTKRNTYFDAIATPVMYDDDSPYKLMMEKLNYISFYYYFSTLPHGQHAAQTEGQQLRHSIMQSFRSYASTLLQRHDEIEHIIIDNVYRISANHTDEAEAIKKLYAALLKVQAFIQKQLYVVPSPKYTKTEIESLRRKACEQKQDDDTNPNNRYIQAYHRAMVEQTVWVCRQLTRRATGRFLTHIVELLSCEFSLGLHEQAQADTAIRSNTSSALPADLAPLVEDMAESVHDTWMKTRLEQGWTYGTSRNDMLKTHPGLVPYDELPEEEKEYDRRTSIKTLEFITTHGYNIVKKQ